MLKLDGQRVFITGASRGVGLATARGFLDAGACVGMCALNGVRLEEVSRSLGAGGRVVAHAADVREPRQIQDTVGAVESAFGGIDVLVNNAGNVWVGPYAEQPYESIADVIDVNLKGVMYTTRAVIPGMIGAGRGVVINISSGAGLTGFGEVAAYCAAKFGVVGFTESLHQEVADQGIQVYGLCPGRIATDMQVAYSGARVGMAPERMAHKIMDLAARRPTKGAGQCIPVV